MSSVVGLWEGREMGGSRDGLHSVYGRPGDNERSLDIIQKGTLASTKKFSFLKILLM